jgi:hypothetical protein
MAHDVCTSRAPLALLLLVSCAPVPRTPPSSVDPLSSDALMKDVAVLVDPALDGRAAGSPGERRAAEHAEEVLRAAGLVPHRQEVKLEGQSPSVNVYAVLEGRRTDEVIVIGAHLDHLGRVGGVLYPGAEDNASGVAVVLGLARAMASRRSELDRSIVFVLFGAEEIGLRGSAAFVEGGPINVSRMRAMVNVDMIGRRLVDQGGMGWLKRPVGIDDTRSVGLVGARHYPGLRALVDTACEQEGVRAIAAEDFPGRIEREIEAQALGRGDSASFESRGVPSLFFGSGESDDYHAPTDTIETLRPDVMSRRARALLIVLRALSTAPEAAFARAPDDARPPPKRLPRSVHLPFGLTTGVALRGRASYFVGVEASLVHISTPSLFWIGAYADALYDFGPRAFRTSFGPELGWGPLGFDAGMLLERTESERRVGLVARPLLTLSWVALSGRIGWFFEERTTFGEIGLLVKLPNAL